MKSKHILNKTQESGGLAVLLQDNSLHLLTYFIRRLFFALFTLWLISVTLFGLSKCTPGHPVEQLFEQNTSNGAASGWQNATEFREKAALLGLDKPTFYFTVQSRAYPDTLHNIFPPDYRDQLTELIDQTGNATASSIWLADTRRVQASTDVLALTEEGQQLKNVIGQLVQARRLSEIEALMAQYMAIQFNQQALDAQVGLRDMLDKSFIQLKLTQKSAFNRLPHMLWHGTDNQYHRWIKAALRFDFGRSYRNRMEVSQILGTKLRRTALIGLCSLVLAFGLGIPLGVRSAARSRKSLEDSRANKLALFIYAIPGFWLGSLLTLFFATPWAGMQIFQFGCINGGEQSVFVWFTRSFSCLVLPILVMAIHIGAVIFLQMRTAMSEVLQRDFIRTARLKGLPEGTVIWRHAFPNAMFPIVTMLGGVLAFMVAGSVVIEHLFTLPGMGSELVDAYTSRDFPVLFAILMLYSVAIVLGNLLADMLYAWLDPRVRYG